MWKSRTGTCSLKCVFKQSGMNTPAFFRRKPYQYVRPSHTKNSKSSGSPSRGLFNGSWSATFCMTLDKLSEKLRAQITMLQRHCPAPLKKKYIDEEVYTQIRFLLLTEVVTIQRNPKPFSCKGLTSCDAGCQGHWRFDGMTCFTQTVLTD